MTRYPWLDGMRGVAAVYVLMHHAAAEVHTRDLPRGVVEATAWLEYGHLAVAVFIVLSGFSLMMPVARDGGIRGGLRGYFARRGRRILPAYYASLGLILLLIAATPVLQTPNGNDRWDFALPAFDLRAILAHLLLIHDLDRSWILKIDPPMWSVAVEWQIYFLFPILVWAWRRAGHALSLVLALATSQAAMAWMGVPLSRLACPWYAVLFALGMVAASAKEGVARLFPRRSWPIWVVAGALAIDLGASGGLVRTDLLVGLATASVVAVLARVGRGDGGVVGRMLGSRPVVFLGAISYSVYLIHFPILAMASNLMLAHAVDSRARLAVLLFVVSPIVLAVASLFHRVFERPFLVGPRHDEARPESPPLEPVPGGVQASS